MFEYAMCNLTLLLFFLLLSQIQLFLLLLSGYQLASSCKGIGTLNTYKRALQTRFVHGLRGLEVMFQKEKNRQVDDF